MELKDNERHKYETIRKVVENKMTRKEAMAELKISRQQIYRLVKIYNEEGEKGFIHKNQGKISKKRLDKCIISKIEDLYLNEYYDYNFEHFYEQIKDRYVISYPSLHSYFLNDDIISPIAHKKTIKLYNKKMNKAIHNKEEKMIEEKEELFKSRILAYEKAHPRKSSNLYSFGQEIQMDACENFWFGGIVSYLHLAVDKATKKVLFGWFEYEEITRGYFVLLYNIIINYGIPYKIKADNRNSFSNNKNMVNTTQFGIICEDLGIILETSSVPTAKPNVERENKTFKDRLIAELRHEGIVQIDEANRYINEVFIPKINKKFSYVIDEKTSKMRPSSYTEEELNLIISEKYTRIIDNASSIKYNNKYYIPVDPITGETINYMRGSECTFIITYNSEQWCKIEEKYYVLVELENRDTIMKKEQDNKKPTKRKKYVPPKNHPWRKNMMLKKRNWGSAPNPEV